MKKVGLSLTNLNRETLDKNYGILSLTKTKDNLVMWAHYASDHSGFLIEFNDFLWTPPDNLIRHSIRFEEVKYSRERPYFDSLVNQLQSENLLENFYYESLITKSIHWKYENEIRLINNLQNATEVLDGIFYLFSFDPKSISSIYLGQMMKPEVKDEIVSILTKEKYEHVKIYQSELHKAKYKLVFKRIK